MNGNGEYCAGRAVGAADRGLAADLAYDRRPRNGRARAHVQTVARVFFCPECREEFRVPEALGGHLERHRPVGAPVYSRPRRKTPVQRSIECPKGCGRHFANVTGAHEMKKGLLNEHEPN